ncbi:MAG: class I SAM-dependent rRNA methyltransferase [Candidatus Omnitrophica bacterium]|nr:class I SAM-dependent rRNA methyltransferase [Candidatus Omnitrophota bacterium]
MKILRCILKEDKEKPLEGRHPWVFSGAIDQIEDGFQAGDLVKVYSNREKFLGIGYLNPRSQIAIRMLTFDDVKIDEGFFEKRIQNALRLRTSFLPSKTNAYRVIHSEGDFLPGLIADRYNDYLVLQFLTAGMDHWKPVFVKIFEKLIPVKGIFEKDDTEQRDWEGLPKRVERLAGEEPPDFVEIEENGIRFLVDIHQGQKTGFYLDQRDGRMLVGAHSRGKRVLNCFSYTGGFSLYAARGGAAEVVSVESSEPALNTAKNNFEKNNLTGTQYQFMQEDVFEYLRSSRQEFDFIILDPPAFCKNKHQVQQAARGYKDINLYALKRLAPGGLLFTSSCSSYITPDLFQKIVFGAAKDARRDVQILAKTSHGFDHPISIYHPEGEYLKGLLCQVS